MLSGPGRNWGAGGGSLNSEVQCLGPLAKAGGDLGWRAGQGVGTSVWWDPKVRKR